MGWSGGYGSWRSGNLVFPSRLRCRQRRRAWPLEYPRHPCDASRSGRTARIPRPTGKELRTYRTSGLVHEHRLVSDLRVSLAYEPGRGRCGSRLARSRRGVELVGWAGAVWRSYTASEGFAALVRDIVHHIYAGRDTLRGPTAYMGRSRLVSAWVRALVAQR